MESQWGKADADHFGYESDEDRKSKRGLEDWELVEKMPESQKPVPYWFFAVVLVVLLVGIGLSFPFWGLRPGDHRPWLDWGYLIALVYIAVAGSLRLVHGAHVRLIVEGRPDDRSQNERSRR